MWDFFKEYAGKRETSWLRLHIRSRFYRCIECADIFIILTTFCHRNHEHV